jgi:hypothetical protein
METAPGLLGGIRFGVDYPARDSALKALERLGLESPSDPFPRGLHGCFCPIQDTT